MAVVGNAVIATLFVKLKIDSCLNNCFQALLIAVRYFIASRCNTNF